MRTLILATALILLGTAATHAQSSSERIVLDADSSVARSFGSPVDRVRADRLRRGGETNRDFFRDRAANTFDTAAAVQIARLDAMILQGAVIPGVLETAIQSDLPGMVRAVMSRDVRSFDGRRVLLSAGTRLVGEYSSAVARGQSRVFIIWKRAIRPDGLSIALDSFGTDPLGRSGVAGRVNRHLLERFGAAAVLTLIGGASELLVGLAQEGVNEAGSRVQIDARINAAEGLADNAQGVAELALQDTIDVPPTIHVAQGTRIQIFTTRDLDFSAFYPDPVEEEIDRILTRNADARHVQPVYK